MTGGTIEEIVHGKISRHNAQAKEHWINKEIQICCLEFVANQAFKAGQESEDDKHLAEVGELIGKLKQAQDKVKEILSNPSAFGLVKIEDIDITDIEKDI